MSHFDAALEAELLTQDFRQMYLHWHQKREPRTGIHASAILASDKEYCARELVLLNLYGDQAEQGESAPGWWEWKKAAIFENGWRLHQRWQDVFRKCGNVVWSAVTPEEALNIPAFLLRMIDGQTCAPELDLTHYDSERNIFFSPDAIILFGGERYIVEIKGIKEQSYLPLTDDLEQACESCETIHKAREQCNLYMHLTGISKGIILVENKNTCDFKVYVIEHDEDRAMKYIERIYDVKGKTAVVKAGWTNKLPARTCRSINDTRAQKCPMKNVCFKQESEEW